MPDDMELFSCRGGNYSIVIFADRIVIRGAILSGSKTYELPLRRIRSLVVERKTVIPFAAAMLLAIIATLISKYNALWFLVNLSPENRWNLSTIALFAGVLFAVPTISRVFFVNVAVSWNGEPPSFRIRFVPAHLGRRLARTFQEATVAS